MINLMTESTNKYNFAGFWVSLPQLPETQLVEALMGASVRIKMKICPKFVSFVGRNNK